MADKDAATVRVRRRRASFGGAGRNLEAQASPKGLAGRGRFLACIGPECRRQISNDTIPMGITFFIRTFEPLNPWILKSLGPRSFIQQSNHKGQNTSTSGIATTSTRMLNGSPRRQ